MPRRQYSDQERADALVLLDANRGNISKTSREIDVPWSTIKEWVLGNHHDDVTLLREFKREHFISVFGEKTLALLGGITEEKIAAAPVKDLMIGAGVGIDKILALSGEAPAGGKVDINVLIQNRLGPAEVPEL